MIVLNFINEYKSEYNQYQSMYQEISLTVQNYLKLTNNYILSVSLIDNNHIHTINRDYRKIDRPTDVISFANDIIDPFDLENDLGDIFISVEQALIQAHDYGHSIRREMLFLFVHGLLHCLGYDHSNKEDEFEMNNLQEVILDEYEQQKSF